MATLAALAKMAATDHPDQLARTARPAALAKTERKVQPAPQPSAPHRPPATLAQPERTARPAHLVKTAHLVPMEAPARQETKDRPDRLARPATMELPATKDHQVPMAPPARRVSVPNIAPPMAASSSRMEHGDKRDRYRFCYDDEKPVFLMSMFAFFIIFIMFDSRSSSVINTAAASPFNTSFGAFLRYVD